MHHSPMSTKSRSTLGKYSSFVSERCISMYFAVDQHCMKVTNSHSAAHLLHLKRSAARNHDERFHDGDREVGDQEPSHPPVGASGVPNRGEQPRDREERHEGRDLPRIDEPAKEDVERVLRKGFVVILDRTLGAVELSDDAVVLEEDVPELGPLGSLHLVNLLIGYVHLRRLPSAGQVDAHGELPELEDERRQVKVSEIVFRQDGDLGIGRGVVPHDGQVRDGSRDAGEDGREDAV
mmetsp:Transcript_16847/g.36506  ORF Transcript_16847/g.36506 Transcript_16847/m.36506 type:complete len:236 (-) Transcript_16847:143-850(-)